PSVRRFVTSGAEDENHEPDENVSNEGSVHEETRAGPPLLAASHRQVKHHRYASAMTASDSEKTWEDHWASHDTPWDAGESSPALRALLASLEPAPQARALIPGCGRGWDVFTLSRHGFTAVGIDIAPSAAPAFEKIRQEQDLTIHQAHLVVGDFFQLDAA